VNDDLHFVQVTFWEQRTDRTIDQTRCQCFFFGRTAFTFEKTTWNTTGSVGFLYIINGQWEEVLTWFCIFASDNRCEYDRIFDRDEYGTGSLTSDFAGFKRDRMLTILESFSDFIKHGVPF